MAIQHRCDKGQDGHVGVRVVSGGRDDAPLVAQLQIDATLAAYGRIFPASAPPPVFDEVLAEWRDRLGGVAATGQTTLVAVDDGRIVGVVVAGPDLVRPDRGHVARFYVAPDRWGQGIGRRLYLAALGWLRRGDYREATLWVLERNDRARAWYERLGWRTTGERKTVYEPAGIVDLQYLIRLAEPARSRGRRCRSPPVARRFEHRAMTEVRSAGTVGDLLTSRRRDRFVGRTSEVELFRVALESPEPPFLLLHLHGPPGIGKTSLLEVYAGLAADAGATVVRLDGRDLVPSTPAVLQVFGEVLELPAGDGAISGPPGGGRLVVLFDTYERLAPLDDWVRTVLLPQLPADAVTVFAGREPPGPAWRADPAWRELLRVVSLRNLSPEDSRRYLHGCGVEPARHDQLIELAHGHPLGLSLLADVVVRGGEAAADPLTPDLVGTLLQRFVEVVPSGLHRRALEVCAIARVTTEGLLREVLGVEDAHDPFSWLRGLSFVESGPDGVFPHDLARDALEADLRWRDPDSYRRVFRAVRGHINARLRTSQDQEQQRAIADAKYMFRRLPGVVSPLDWDVWGQQYPEPAAPSDREAILDLVLVGRGRGVGGDRGAMVGAATGGLLRGPQP